MESDLLAPVDSETLDFNHSLEELLRQYPLLTELEPAEARRLREEGKSVWGPLALSPNAIERAIPGPTGDLKVRMFLPAQARAVYLHFHGGGWVLGGIHHQDPRLEALASRCRVAVFSVDYRLAPEHPYPAGPEDCEAAALWLAEHAREEFGTDRILIGGESAGAHLAAVTMIRMRDRHGYNRFAGANLVYGTFDLRLSPSARQWGERLLVLNTPYIEWFLDRFVSPEQRADPDVSPLLADLTGLPPALFTIGTEDPLLDDTLFMYSRWLAAGNRAELAVYPGGAHGFDAFPIALGRRALARMHDFADRMVS
jgi:acetyl esterase/lipase